MDTAETRDFWDRQAATFDDEPDHGLRDRRTYEAWRGLFAGHLDKPSSRIADLGCGTGTLSVLLANEGHSVTGIDLSPAMIERAREKAAGVETCHFDVGDAGSPDLPSGRFDVVLGRHVLWAMDDPRDALRRWRALLDDGGRMLLVEGFWSTGAGLTAATTLDLLDGLGVTAQHTPLTDAVYWGREISDERYLLTVTLAGSRRGRGR